MTAGRALVLSAAALLTAHALVAGPAAGAPSFNGWGPVSALLPANISTFEPVLLAGDPWGSAFCMWVQYQGKAWAAQYHVETGWSAPFRLTGAVNNSSLGNSVDHALAVDGGGNAVFVWNQFNSGGSASVAMAAEYTVGSGWSGPYTLSGVFGNVDDTAVAFSAAGTAVATWTSGSDVVAAVRTGVGVWQTAAAIDAGAPAAGSARPAMDAGGNATVAWIQSDGSAPSVYARRLPAGGIWGNATVIDGFASNGTAELAVAANGRGQAAVLMTVQEAAANHVFATRFDASTGWSTPARVDNRSGQAEWPAIGIDDGGNAVAMWRQFDGATQSVFTSRSAPTGGWDAPRAAENATGPIGAPCSLHVEPSGWASSVCDTGSASFFVTRYDPLRGWNTTPVGLPAVPNLSPTTGPRILVSDRGDLLLAWSGGDPMTSALNIYWALLAEVDTVAPAVDIGSPPNNSTVALPTVRVNGTSEPFARVMAGGVAVEASANGSFEMVLPLAEGINRIVVSARDAAGNTGSSELVIRFADPVPGLLEALAGADAAILNLSALQNLTAAALAQQAAEVALLRELANQLNDSLDLLEGRTDAQQAEIDALAMEAQQLDQGLLAAQVRIQQLEAQGAGLADALQGLNATLTLLEADLAQVRADVAVHGTGLSTLSGRLDAVEAELAAARAAAAALAIHAATVWSAQNLTTALLNASLAEARQDVSALTDRIADVEDELQAEEERARSAQGALRADLSRAEMLNMVALTAVAGVAGMAWLLSRRNARPPGL